MKKYTKLFAILMALYLLAMSAYITQAIGGVDDFEDGTLQNWQQGITPIFNIPDGGPTGTGDNYLQLVATGGSGNGSKLITANTSQWTGDFSAANAGRVHLQAFCDSCPNDLSLRIVIGNAFRPNSGGTWFASTVPFTLVNDGTWQSHVFSLAEADMTLVQGTDAYSTVFADVQGFRILHSTVPAPRGDTIVATVGLDNIAPQTPTALALSGASVGVMATDMTLWVMMLGLGMVTFLAWWRWVVMPAKTRVRRTQHEQF